MGSTAIVSSSASSSSVGTGVTSTVTSLLSPVGLGVGGIFVAAALIYLLAYLNLTSAVEADMQDLQRILIVATIPLFVVFAGIVTFKSLQLL